VHAASSLAIEIAMIELGRIEALFRYPVKSMRGESLAAAPLGWHGIECDRRFAIRRLDDAGGFPWLTASKLPDLVRFTPLRQTPSDENELPTRVRTPDADELPLLGDALAADIAGRCGLAVQILQLRQGIFDEASVSVIGSATVREVCRLGGVPDDVRRFRPNILLRSTGETPFEEDAWVGGTVTFGDGPRTPAIAITMRDLRCVMVNIDPDRASTDPQVLKAVVSANQSHAGVYAAVVRTGPLAVGDKVFLHR